MKNTIRKDILRNIRKNFVSWLAISIVMMIGCGVYFGAFFYADAMEETGEQFFSETGFEDLDVVTVHGIREEEIKKLTEIDGLLDAEGTYQLTDLSAYHGEDSFPVTVMGLTERIGTIKLLSGRLPEAAKECALTTDTMKKYGIVLGDEIRIDAPENVPEGFLKAETYTVTAEVAHPDDYRVGYRNDLFLPAETFDQEALDGMYTYVRVKAELPEKIDLFDSAYFDALDPVQTALRERLDEIGKTRTEELRQKAEEQIEEKRNELSSALSSAEKELSDAEEEIAAGESAIDEAKKELANAKEELNKKEQELLAAERQYGMTLSGPRAQLREAEETLANKEAELAEKETSLAEAKEALSEGKASYQEKKSEGEAQIKEAEEKIEKLDASAYVVMTRNEMDSFVSLRQMVETLKKLATVFAAIFLIVGVVVVSSTLSIVIDGQKKQIGTMKAYGFRNSEIIAKYLTYGVSAAVFGMLLSIVLCFGLEIIIARVVGGMFCLNAPVFTFRFGPYVVLLIAELSLAAIVSAVVTYRSAIRTSAVDLMNGIVKERKRRSSAASGKGSLYSKLILRNMRSDLPRVIASIIIIAGSCLMMGVGFTLYEAFNTMMSRSHAEEMHFELEISGGAESTAETEDALRKKLQEEGLAFAEVTKKDTFYQYGGGEGVATVLVIPEELCPDYMELRDRNGSALSLPQGAGVLVTNRLSERYQILPGEPIAIYDDAMKPQGTTVDGVFQNYYGRYLLVSRQGYEEIFGEEAKANTFWVRTGDRDVDSVASQIAADFPEYSIVYEDRLPEGFSGLTKMYNALVIVMAGLSVLMSIFVLLNLVNIFVRRRRNELIIMGANGFSYPERIGYLLRETVLMTGSGLLVGILVGAGLTSFLVRTVEAADTTFNRSVSPISWGIACLLEAGFALAINAFAFRSVKKLDFTDLTK